MLEIIPYLNTLNWQTMVAMFAICWYFTRDIKNSVDKLDKDFREQSKRTDRLYEMFIQLLRENNGK